MFDQLPQILRTSPENGLDQLGTLLREPSARADPAAAQLIPAACDLYKFHPHSVLRVLVNFTADNTANRESLLNNEKFGAFWSAVLAEFSADEVTNSRIMLLLTQFIHGVDDDHLRSFLERLFQLGALKWVLEYCEVCVGEKDGASLVSVTEFIAEMAQLHPTSTLPYLALIADAFRVANEDEDLELEEKGEIYLYCAQTLFKSTNIEDVKTENLTVAPATILELLPLVNSEIPEFSTIKRTLFAACGNIYSYPSFDNFSVSHENIELLNTSADPYVVAAAAVSLGNCVSSHDTQNRLVAAMGGDMGVAKSGERLLKMNFGDVVQFQAFHLLNNTMTETVARRLLSCSNTGLLQRNTKVMVDNFDYYKEIGHLYGKFLRKLVTAAHLETADVDFKSLEPVLELVAEKPEFVEAAMVVLQAISKRSDKVKNDRMKNEKMGSDKIEEIETTEITHENYEDDSFVSQPLVDKLVHATMTMEGSVDARVLLQRLTTMAIYLTNSPKITDLGFVGDLTQFLGTVAASRDAGAGTGTATAFEDAQAEQCAESAEQQIPDKPAGAREAEEPNLAIGAENVAGFSAAAAVLNNAKYVAGCAKKLASQICARWPEPAEQLDQVCNDILRKSN